MGTTLRVIDYEGIINATGEPPEVQIGDVWYDPFIFNGTALPSAAFQALGGARLPIVLRLPDASGQGGSNWCPDALPADPVEISGNILYPTPLLDGGTGSETEWAVDEQTTTLVPGQACNLTVTPGAWLPGQYRGSLTSGVLADNTEVP